MPVLTAALTVLLVAGCGGAARVSPTAATAGTAGTAAAAGTAATTATAGTAAAAGTAATTATATTATATTATATTASAVAAGRPVATVAHGHVAIAALTGAARRAGPGRRRGARATRPPGVRGRVAATPTPDLPPARRYLLRRARAPRNDDEARAAATPRRAPTWSYQVTLRRGGRATPGPTARLTLRGDRVCWRFAGVRERTTASAAFGRARSPGAAGAPGAAAIRSGAAGRSGPVLVVLGARFAPQGCTVVAPIVVNSLAAAPRLYHLSLTGHGSALRAQL